MHWTDIVMLMLSATLANHLGLVEAVEGVIGHRIPVLNCSKCASFWVVLICSLLSGQGPIASVAVSFFCAYAAVWAELLFGYVDTLYNRLYESIYSKETGDAADTEDRLS